jgi:ribonuclease D
MNNIIFKNKISREEIALLPRRKFTGEIFYVDSKEAFKSFFPEFKHNGLLGFDTETRPTFTKGAGNGVALLQLSTGEQAFLVRLNLIGLPGELLDILTDRFIIKAGVAIHDDIAGLKKLTPFEPNGFVELQDYVKDFGIADAGLKKLSANILGFQISKRQQTSNWEQDELTTPQIEYAATDAWVCHEIFTQLNRIRKLNGNSN